MSLIQIVKAVDSVKRKPQEYKHFTFFSAYDLWEYTAVLDDRLCEKCLGYEATPRYLGSELRMLFPYLEIVDENTINVNVHPNCRCTLTRITEWTPDILKWFIEYVPRKGEAEPY